LHIRQPTCNLTVANKEWCSGAWRARPYRSHLPGRSRADPYIEQPNYVGFRDGGGKLVGPVTDADGNMIGLIQQAH
jgi:hypothetical protein